MGPVIASIHEKRDELRPQIMAEAELDSEPAARAATASGRCSAIGHGFEPEHARDIGLVLGIVAGMALAVVDDDLAKIER